MKFRVDITQVYVDVEAQDEAEAAAKAKTMLEEANIFTLATDVLVSELGFDRNGMTKRVSVRIADV